VKIEKGCGPPIGGPQPFCFLLHIREIASGDSSPFIAFVRHRQTPEKLRFFKAFFKSGLQDSNLSAGMFAPY
jgi:hypothetical protein